MSDSKSSPAVAPGHPQKKTVPLFSAKAIKDMKFTLYGLIIVLIVLSYWGYIMRQFVVHRNISWAWCIGYFSSFAVVVYGFGYFVIMQLYPWVYAEELREEQLAREKKLQ